MVAMDVASKLNQQNFSELLDICFQLLSGKSPQASQTSNLLKKLCESCNIEISDAEPLVKALLKILKDGIKYQKASSVLVEEMRKLGLSDDQLDVFKNKWEKDHTSLVPSTVSTAVEVNPLLDMEWKFGVTSASSEVNTVGNVFLQLKLDVDKGNAQTDSVCFELQLPEFYSFLHELEKAKATLDYLS